MTRRWRDLGLATLGLVALLLVPLLGASSAIRDFIMFAMAYGLLAMSLNLLIGYTGLVSFGHAMFFASGAYAFGLAMQSGKFSIPAAFALAIVFTAVLAVVIGAICAARTSWHVGHTGTLCGSRDGTHFLPHNATTGFPCT